jgi:hypothetical protein
MSDRVNISVDRNSGSVVGLNQGGYVAARDLFMGDQYVAQETLYFEPNLIDIEPPSWGITPKTKELVTFLHSQRVIILAGQDLDDKTMVARHLAWLLRKRLSLSSVVIREWYRSSDPQKIEAALDPKNITILILPQIRPHHVAHRVSELRGLLQRRKHFAVITTDASRSDWAIEKNSPDEIYWQELSWEVYYGLPLLTDLLLKKLTATGGHLPEGFPHQPEATSLVASNLTVGAAAARLKQPQRIILFAERLRSGAATSSPEIHACIDQLGGDREAILHWYQQLGRPHQLLALGLVLFDGLSDDQIFAALEFLVNEAWRDTDPNLPLFDYSDFEGLGTHFRLTETGKDGTRIETSAQQRREAIFYAAWKRQRRRLLTIIPALTRLVKDLAPTPARAVSATTNGTPSWFRRNKQPAGAAKASDPESSWRFTHGPARELFSSPRRVEQLRRSVIEALSQIGLLSFEAVEASFLDLAIDGSPAFQTIVAKALAAWRGDGHSDQFFEVLRGWWEDGLRSSLPRSLRERTTPQGVEPLVQMRATVATAAAYALQYDPPNELPDVLFDLLRELAQDFHPLIRQRFVDLTLPLAVASHFRQLESWLRTDLILDQDLMYATAFGAAMGYSLRPAEIELVLVQWHVSVQALGPRGTDSAITSRDRLLATVALTYGYIRCEESLGFLTPIEIISTLRAILAVEPHPFVRAHVLMAVGLQAVHNFELAAPILVELIAEITLPDRLHVVSIFVRAYLYQRERLTDGDEEIEIAGRRFQIWTRSPRPLTAIEQSLYSWLRDDRYPVAQQVAVQAFAAFSATPLEKGERSFAPQPRPAGRPVVQNDSILVNPERLHDLPALGHFALFLAIPRKRRMRKLLKPVMAEVLDIRQTDQSGHGYDAIAAAASQNDRKAPPVSSPVSPSIMETVLLRWRLAFDHDVRSLTRTLEAALAIYRWRWPILATIVLCLGLLYHDARDWQTTFARSTTDEEEFAIQQRRQAPPRIAWNLWKREFRRREEIRIAEEIREQEELRRQAEEQAKKAKDKTVFNGSLAEKGGEEHTGAGSHGQVGKEKPIVLAVATEVPATDPLGRPAEHLMRSAEFRLLRGSHDQERAWLLRILPALRRYRVVEPPRPEKKPQDGLPRQSEDHSLPDAPPPQAPPPLPLSRRPESGEPQRREDAKESARPAGRMGTPLPPGAGRFFQELRPDIQLGSTGRVNRQPRASKGAEHGRQRPGQGEARDGSPGNKHPHPAQHGNHRG